MLQSALHVFCQRHTPSPLLSTLLPILFLERGGTILNKGPSLRLGAFARG